MLPSGNNHTHLGLSINMCLKLEYYHIYFEDWDRNVSRTI